MSDVGSEIVESEESCGGTENRKSEEIIHKQDFLHQVFGDVGEVFGGRFHHKFLLFDLRR